MDASQLRVMRVVADLDVAPYEAGATKKVAADNAMSNSGKGVSDTLRQTDTKVSAAGDNLSKLSRRYIEGYAAAERFNAGIGQVGRGLDTGRLSMDQASNIITGMTQRLGVAANASELLARGQTQLANAVDIANKRLQDQSRIQARAPAANQNASGAASFQTSNIAAQFQDIGVTTAMGMSPLQIALQQGTQLSAVFEQMRASGTSVASGLAAAFMQVVSPISLITVGVIAATAAAVQYFTATDDDTSKANEALERHGDLIARLKDRYGEAAAGLQAYTKESSLVLQADLQRSREQYGATIASGAQAALNVRGYADELDPQSPLFGKIAGAISELRAALDRGEPSLKAFVDRLAALEINPYVTESQKEFIRTIRDTDEVVTGLSAERALGGLGTLFSDAGNNAREASKAINGFADALSRLDSVGKAQPSVSDQALSSLRDAVSTAEGPLQRQEAIRRYDEAQRRLIDNADAERSAQALAGAGSRPNDIEILDARTAAREQAEKETERVRKDREREDERKRRDAERARQPYENMAGRQRDQLELLRAEAGMLGQSDSARQQVIASLQLEQEIRRLGIPLYGEEAQALRANATEIIQLQQQRSEAVKRAAEVERDWSENREIAKGFLTDLSDGLRDGAGLWKSFADAAVNALNRITDKLLDRAFEGILDALMPKPGGSGTVAGGTGFASTAGGFAAMMFGAGGSASIASGLTTASPSSVNARSMSGTVAEQAFSFFKSKGMSDLAAAAMVGQAHAESGFNPRAIGDNGAAFGLFQHHAARGGGQGLLNSGVQGQLEHAWQELQGSEHGVFTRLQAATTPREATRAAIGFERPQGWSAANPEGGHNFSGRLSATEQALTKFGGTANNAAKAVDTMTTGAIDAGKGLGQLGSNFANFFPPAPAMPSGGGGGFGGFLSGLFGRGVGGATFGSMSAISPMAASFISGGGFGLFSEGGYTGPGGVNDPRGVVHAGEVVWSQRDVARAGGPSVVDAMRRGVAGYAVGGTVGRNPSPPANGSRPFNVRSEVYDLAGVNVSTEERQDEDGVVMQTFIEKRVAAGMGRNGSPVDRAIKQNYGAKRELMRR